MKLVVVFAVINDTYAKAFPAVVRYLEVTHRKETRLFNEDSEELYDMARNSRTGPLFGFPPPLFPKEAEQTDWQKERISTSERSGESRPRSSIDGGHR